MDSDDVHAVLLLISILFSRPPLLLSPLSGEATNVPPAALPDPAPASSSLPPSLASTEQRSALLKPTTWLLSTIALARRRPLLSPMAANHP